MRATAREGVRTTPFRELRSLTPLARRLALRLRKARIATLLFLFNAWFLFKESYIYAMDPFSDKPDDKRLDSDAVARALEGHMDNIMELLEAIAAEVPDADMKLAELLEGEASSQVRVAIIEKLQALLRGLAAEKEKELEKFLDAEKRVEVERQRNVFMQWLQWIMSEETLRKIRDAFLASPAMQQRVHEIGHELAARGVLNQLVPGEGKKALGELSANVAAVAAQQAKDKGRGT